MFGDDSDLLSALDVLGHWRRKTGLVSSRIHHVGQEKFSDVAKVPNRGGMVHKICSLVYIMVWGSLFLGHCQFLHTLNFLFGKKS